MAKRRPKLPTHVEKEVLLKSGRRCCICVGLHNDLVVKKGQIAHLDHNPSNNNQDNLAFLCMDHHDEFDSETSQTKKLTMHEIQHYRDQLYTQLDAPEARAAPAPPQRGDTVISIGQSGGVTAHTFINEAPEPEVNCFTVYGNEPDGGIFKTRFRLEVTSQYPVGNLYVEVRAPSLYMMSVIPMRTGVCMLGHSSNTEGRCFTNIPNAFGNYQVDLLTRKLEMRFETDTRI